MPRVSLILVSLPITSLWTSEMRVLFKHIRQLVEKRYLNGPDADSNSELPWQSVSAFCFLRFIVPAILHPHLFGLCSGMSPCLGMHRYENKSLGLPDLPVQRSLTLIAKVIQSLANLNAVHSIQSWLYLWLTDSSDSPKRTVHARCQIVPRRKVTRDVGLHIGCLDANIRGTFTTTIRRSPCTESCH